MYSDFEHIFNTDILIGRRIVDIFLFSMKFNIAVTVVDLDVHF